MLLHAEHLYLQPLMTAFNCQVYVCFVCFITGIIFGVGIFGPAIAFFLGGLFSRIYVTLEGIHVQEKTYLVTCALREDCAMLVFAAFLYIITKTCLYNFEPTKPHFYIVKLGFTGVYILFLFLLKI